MSEEEDDFRGAWEVVRQLDEKADEDDFRRAWELLRQFEKVINNYRYRGLQLRDVLSACTTLIGTALKKFPPSERQHQAEVIKKNVARHLDYIVQQKNLD